jgi:hypothetical protein
MSCTHQRNKKGVACDMYEGGEVQTVCWWGNLWERGRLEDICDRRVLHISLGRVWAGLIGSVTGSVLSR